MTRTLKIFFALLLFFSSTNNSLANHADGHKGKTGEIANHLKEENIKPKQNEVILIVSGVVCSFCSYGVQKKLSKLDFVDTNKFNKKGSLVNIENQRVTIAIKEGFEANLDVIFEKIESGGYKPIKAYVTNEAGEISTYNPK
jgi:CRISPR/Cas system-associated protein Cas5 (RAMP superfamily)